MTGDSLPVDNLRALTLHQPWASFIAAGVKTIETRSWSTRYRGPLAIHAGVRPIGNGALYIGDGKSGWTNVTGEPIANGQQAMSGGIDKLLVCPLGAIVATCTLVDVLPMHDTCTEPIPDDLLYVTIDGRSLFRQRVHGDPWVASNVEQIDLTDQLPYGDFTPGRYAWLLDDIKPTTERCPACWGTVYVCAHGPASECEAGYPHGSHLCATCDATGRCDPIPAKGKQGLWTTEIPAKHLGSSTQEPMP